MMMPRVSFLLFVFLFSFGIFTYNARPLYSSVPLACLITYGAARVTQKESHIRGRRRIKYGKAREIAESKRDSKDKGLKWGGITLPNYFKNLGFFFMGAPGSGKSVSLQMLMYQAFVEDPEAIGVIHDYKMELHAFLRWAGVPSEEIKIMNPYDRRAVGWDIQKDCLDKGTAGEIADGFVPLTQGERAPFFTLSAQSILRDVMVFFLNESERRPEFRWTFREVLAATYNVDLLKTMFESSPEFKPTLTAISNSDVLATLYKSIGQVEEVAALWEGKELISFHEWRQQKKRQILIFGNDSQRKSTVQTLNALLIRQAMKATVKNERPKQDTWFFLDELHAMGRVHELEEMINTVRGYRGNVVLATQDINQVMQTYGEKNANSIIQGCQSKAFLYCSGDAAEWAEKQIGNKEIHQETEGQSADGHRYTRTKSTTPHPSPVVRKEEIEQLPECKPETGLSGFYLTKYISDIYQCTMPFEDFIHVWPTPKIEMDYDIENDRQKKKLRLFTPKELKELELLQEEEPDQDQKQKEKDGQKQRTKTRFRSSFDS